MGADSEGGELIQHLNTETGILEMIDGAGNVVKAYDMKGDFKVEEVSITPEGYKANPIPNDSGFVPHALEVEDEDEEDLFEGMSFGDENEGLSAKEIKMKDYDKKAADIWARAEATIPEESPIKRTVFDQLYLGNLSNAEEAVSGFETKVAEAEAPAEASSISEYHYDRETDTLIKG